MIDIDRTAPAVTTRQTLVAAPRDHVFAVLADVERWPDWQPTVSRAVLDGPMAVGATFRWTAGGSRITSTVTALQAPDVIAWTGRGPGVRAIHVWRFTEIEGGTLVHSDESMSGPLARLLPRMTRRLLEKGVEQALAALAAEAERTAPTPAPVTETQAPA